MNPILQLILLLSLIIAAAKAAGSVATRFGQPAVLGELTVGLLLGPTFINILELPVFAHHGGAHPPPGEIVNTLAELGVILLMFVAGMETDLAEMKRVGKVALSAAVGGVLFPGVGGALVALTFGFPYWESVFIGTVLTATSVSITAQTLMELGSLRSKEGSTILGAAVIDDVLGILVLSIVVAFAAGAAGARGAEAADAGMGGGEILAILFRMTLFFVLGWILGRKTFDWLTEKIARLPVSQPLLAFVVVTAFVYAFAAEYLGKVAAITGSYMAGVLFAQTRFKQRIDEGIHPITYTVWVPLFFINIGLQANGREIDATLAWFAAVIILVAILGKVVGCALFALFAGFTPKQGLRVGTGMISRGEVGLIVTGVGLSQGIIERRLFSVMVVMVLVTTLVTPFLLRLVFPRPDRRKPTDSEIFESISHLEMEKKD